MQRWSPTDVLRLIVILGGLVGFYWGATLIGATLATEGSVDIKSALFEGRLKTGSAGVFVCFFALVIIAVTVVPLARGDRPEEGPTSPAASRMRLLYPVLYGLLALVVVAGFNGWSTVIGFSVGMLLLLTGAMIAIARNE
jgi:hypothetical protein